MKQVEKIWAELSAKEVENTQEVELSEEHKVELASGAKIAAALKKLKAASDRLGAADGIYKAVLAYGKVIADAASAKNEAMSVLEEYVKALAALDIKPNEAPAYKSSKAMIDKSEKTIKNATKARESIVSAMKSI
jgi:hypothetical protein